MRPVLHDDLVQLGRMLLAQPRHERQAVCRRAFEEAETADRYRQSCGLWHPTFGDGSLAGWATRHALPPEPRLDDPDYARCLRLILRELENACHTQTNSG